MITRFQALRLVLILLSGLLAAGASAQAPSRGELLYTTHCISCHSTQMHWRDQRAAVDWASLKAQVRRWQAASSLGWTEADIHEVTRYLNETLYRYEQPAGPTASYRRRTFTDLPFTLPAFSPRSALSALSR